MKLLWNVLSVLLLLHVLALVGFIFWLRSDGRLDRERIMRVYETFSMTIEEEKAKQEEETILAKDMQEKIDHMAWLQQVSQGPQTMLDRLDAVQQSDEVSNVLYERMRSEINAFQTLFNNTESLLAAQRETIEAQRAELEARLKAEQERRTSEDFRQAVKLYEQLAPDQTKNMFMRLLQDGKRDEVVEYLAAMQLRKSAAVIGEFQTPPEIDEATQLIERLRQRGMDFAAPAELNDLPVPVAGGGAI